MTKIQKLRVCDCRLAVLLPAVLASSIQLEVTSSRGIMSVVIHLIVTISFIALIARHIYLHFGWKKWLMKFGKMKVATRILWWLYVLTFVSGIIAATHWLAAYTHSPIGGVHGKIGFAMILVAIGHTLKRRKFFKK
ncbi:MAG: hypothetical protein K2H74_06290 [Paramuribaculum sp.]|nr:hypothetical protein [Paramuribaculum sp.]